MVDRGADDGDAWGGVEGLGGEAEFGEEEQGEEEGGDYVDRDGRPGFV